MVQINNHIGLRRKNRSALKENHIGEVLEMLRIAGNLSQRLAAKYAKISESSWHFMEKERAMPSYEHLLNIAAIFDIKPVTLLMIAFNKIYLLESEGSVTLAYNGYETNVVFEGKFTEENYREIKLMMGRQRTYTRRKF